MSVVIAGSAPASFEIKSANLHLVALRLKSPDLDLLAQELKQQYGDMPDFFDHEPLVIDFTLLPSDTGALDFPALLALLRGYRLAPVAFKGGNEALTAAALAAGLAAAPEAATAPERVPRAVARSKIDAASMEQTEESLPDDAPGTAEQTESGQPVIHQAAGPLPALVIDRPLRSGQQVYARGRDLVVMAMVNAGAEVIADGHIHVYAPLRGKAIAGARGNADARIFALSLEPELVSIAGIYRTTDTPLPAEVWGQPTQVRLVSGADGDRLVMEPLKP